MLYAATQEAMSNNAPNTVPQPIFFLLKALSKDNLRVIISNMNDMATLPGYLR